ncbi:MAG: ribose ABC transporter permease [Chloroflexi bacterium]|nr:ribose ABC transporter permease [Chloroflexota bacterium]
MEKDFACPPEEGKHDEGTPTRGKAIDFNFLWQFGVLMALVVMVVIFTIFEPKFLSERNLLNIAEQSSTNAIIAIGMTFVIASAGIDLSVGSVVAFTGVVSASLMQMGFPVPVAILAGLILGGLCGAVMGWLVARANIPPFIATLGGMSVFRGLALLYTDGKPVIGVPDSFRQFGAGDWFGIPSPWILALVGVVIAYFIFNNTKFGEAIIAIGGNEEAANLSGINVNFTKVMIYAISGIMSALGGVILTARLGSAEPIAGSGFEMNAIAAVVMGGSSLMGGEGKILGTIIGALIIGTLRNGLTILNVPTFTQQVAVGIVVVLAVLADQLAKKRS